MNLQQLQTIPSNRAHIKTRIESLNKHLVAEAVTVAEYQRLVKAHLRIIGDWQERLVFENMALLPVDWNNRCH